MNFVLELLATFTDAVFMLWFVPTLVGSSAKYKKWTLVFPCAYLGFQLFFDQCLPGFTLLPMLFVFGLATGLAFSHRPQLIGWSLFSSCAFPLIMMLVNSSCYALLSIYLPNAKTIMQGANTTIRLIYLLIAKICLFVGYQLVLKLFAKEKSMVISNSILAICLSLATAIGLGALMKVATNFNTFRDSVEVLIIAIVLVAVNFSFYLLINQNQKLQKQKYELQIIKERELFEKRRSEEATIIWDNIKKVRHDLNNHFFVLNTLLDSGDKKACQRYLSEVQSTVSTMGNLIKSGNSVIDYLINTKLGDLKNTQVLISGNIADFSDIKDSDLTCMLGNILDNAVEAIAALAEPKRIELYFSKLDENRIVICKNSIAESVLNCNPGLHTKKNNSDYHGLGHQIIESTVKKYGGIVDYFESDGMFCVQLTIPNI